MEKEQIITHPSYGSVSIHRYSGGEREFFGSAIEHEGGVEIVINTAEQHRTLHKDWCIDKKALIKVRMTETQFAQAITHLNTSGTPCTLEYFNGEYIEAPKNIMNKRLEFQNEFKDSLNEIKEYLDETNKAIEEILNKKNISKADRSEMRTLVNRIQTKVVSDLPFVEKCFNETMENIVMEAKDEVEHFVEQKIKNVGLEQIKNMKFLG